MKCSICGKEKEHEVLFAHCKKCLQEDEPSGLMEVSFDEHYVYLYCGNCGEFVAQFKRDESNETKN